MSASIIKFNGGLGNQIFQYAFYLYCESNGISVEADKTVYYTKHIHGGYLLDSLFPTNKICYTTIDTTRYNKPFSLQEKTLNRLFHHVNYHYFEEYFKAVTDVIPFLKKEEFCYLEGWWQDIEYTKVSTEKLKKTKCSLINNPNFTTNATLEIILNSESVSLHIRRGDYLQSRTAKARYGNICTEEYYKHAIEYFKAHYSKAKFFVFSDDIEYCKSLFAGEDYFFVEPSVPELAYVDMLLMSECKHHIIANSSFSWWGAMLSAHAGTIIMPDSWDNVSGNNRLHIPGSLRLNNRGVFID